MRCEYILNMFRVLSQTKGLYKQCVPGDSLMVQLINQSLHRCSIYCAILLYINISICNKDIDIHQVIPGQSRHLAT